MIDYGSMPTEELWKIYRRLSATEHGRLTIVREVVLAELKRRPPVSSQPQSNCCCATVRD